MNKKEIGELRRALQPERAAVTAVKGCYVNGDGKIITTFERSFGISGEEEAVQYLALFRRVLSGRINKNLIDVPFSTYQVTDSEEHALLSRLKKSALSDKEALNAFFEKAAASFDKEENRVVLLIHMSYDVPFRKTGEDESAARENEVYSCILCAVCPVKAGKKGLAFDREKMTFSEAGGEGIVSAPETGFLFPAFDGRQSNIYAALAYAKSAKEFPEDFFFAVFGKIQLPMPAAGQSESFRTVLAESLEKNCTLDAVKAVRRQIEEKIELHKEERDPEPLLLTKEELKEVLLAGGMPEEQTDAFSASYNDAFGASTDLPPENLVPSGRFEVRTPDVVIRVARGSEDLVSARVIDGTKYILVRADGGAEAGGVSIVIE